MLIPLRNSDLVAVIDDSSAHLIAPYAWRLHSKGYAYRWEGRNVYMHRVVAGDPVGKQVDHADGDKLHNRRENLRICLPKENQRNQRKQRRTTSSRYKGVYKAHACSGWVAQIKVDGVASYLGRYATQREAAKVYDAAALERFGEFARLNLPNDPPESLELAQTRKLANISQQKTRCKHGHAFTPENTIPNTGGFKACRECSRRRAREYQRRRRAKS